jgi:uncharacterized membrane protein YccC
MSAFDADTMKLRLWPLWQEAVAWGKSEGWNWIFVFKTTLATLLAMGLSLRFELDQPSTAMITVFIVMQPQTGLVLTKSLYRVGGTLAGAAASLVLVSLFAQQQELFILGLALWVGTCTAGAAFYRNFKSYGFVLAGYTAAMIGLPAALQPQTFFTLASTRLSEVTLGILCAGVVSDIIFPRRLSDDITKNVQSRYTEFIAFVHSSLAGTVGQQELKSIQLRLAGNVIALEAIRGAAALEDPEVRARDRRLRKLNSEFMAASTTFNSFRQLMQRLTKNSAPAGHALDTLYESLGETLGRMGQTPRTADEAHQAARRIAVFRKELSRHVEKVRLSLADPPDSQTRMDFDTAVELLFRFVRELHAYSRTYASLPETKQGPKPPDDIRFFSRTDPVVALLTGVRVFFAILLVGTFWIASAWPSGVNALIFVATVSALCAAFPDPALAAKRMIIGHTAGFIAAFVFKFYVMPSLDGFVLLCAGLVPVLMAGLYLYTNPKWADFGIGFVIFFTNMITPGISMQYNPLVFINDGGALILGVVAAWVMFMTLMPANGAWLKRRLARQLRHQVIMACVDPLAGLIHRFESSTHELLHKLASGQQGLDSLMWMFPVIEIGRAIIHVRQDAVSGRMSQSLSESVQDCVLSTARFFKRPSALNRYATLECVAHASEAVRLEAELESSCGHIRGALRQMLTSLHLIRTSLLDEETFLAATVGYPSSAPLGGTSHAA